MQVSANYVVMACNGQIALLQYEIMK